MPGKDEIRGLDRDPGVSAGVSQRGELGEQMLYPLVGGVANGADVVEGLAGGVVELPVEIALAGETGQASPQPMVITTSAASTASVPSGLGSLWDKEPLDRHSACSSHPDTFWSDLPAWGRQRIRGAVNRVDRLGTDTFPNQRRVRR